MDQALFDKLLSLPLFQGIGRGEFEEIMARIRLGVKKAPSRTVLVREGASCNSLFFIINGAVFSEQYSDKRNYSLLEWFEAPFVLQPESLFGLTTRYTRTFTAVTAVYYIEVDKRSIGDILFNYPTFRFNYLNLLSKQAQQTGRRLWQSIPLTDNAKFLHFLTCRIAHPAGRKELHISMSELAQELQISRQRISQMLRALEGKGELILGREKIEIPAFERLLQSV
jgi:CRP-like cAMP-binding protein